MSLDCGRKPENRKRVDTDTGKTSKLASNLGPYFCELTLSATEPSCHPKTEIIVNKGLHLLYSNAAT